MKRSAGSIKMRRSERSLLWARLAAFSLGRIKRRLSRAGKGFLALLLVVIMLFPSLNTDHVAHAATPAWTTAGINAPSNVKALAEVGGKLYAATGTDIDSTWDNTVWEYQDGRWIRMSGSPSHVFSLANVGGKLYAGTRNGMDDVWVYSGGTWQHMEKSVQAATSFTYVHDAATGGNQLYAGSALGDGVMAYSPMGWYTLLNSPLRVYALADMNGVLYVGSINYQNEDVWYCNSYCYRMSGSPGSVFALLNVNGTLYAGSQKGSVNGDVWAYSGGTWTQLKGSPQKVRSLVYVNDTLYAGTLNGGSAVWSYSNGVWTQLDNSPSNVNALVAANGNLYAGSIDGEIKQMLLPPAVPSNLQASKTTHASTVLSWDAVSGATGYRIYQNGKETAVATGTNPTVRLSGLAPNTSYTFTVNAFIDASESAPSSAIQVKTASTPIYAVLYDGNGSKDGSVPSDNNVYEQGKTAAVLENTGNLARPGYTFAGWNMQADGKGTSYAAGESIPIGAADVTLYAMWTSNFAGGDGSADSPFEIRTADQLNRVRNALSASFKLAANIDLSGYLASGGAGYNDGAGWVPIGTASVPFTGTLDGNGKEITGLLINRPGANNQGLFGYTAASADLQNVGLTGANVSGNNGVGALVGSNNGSITSSRVSGTVSGSYSVGGLAGYNYGSISKAYSTNELTGNGQNVGGLVGENFSVIADSYSERAVTGSNDVGGLVGKNNGNIQHSHATGAVTSKQYGAGGLIGYNNGGSIADSYATGAVKSLGIGDNVGGLIGANDYNGSISRSFATGMVEGNNHAGGLVGSHYGSILESYALGEVHALDEVGGLAGRSNKTSSIELSFSTGAVTGRYYVGGLVGGNEGYVGDAYATGSVKGDQVVGGLVGVHKSERIVNTYATGSVVANVGVGGLVGVNNSNIIDSYYDKETTGQLDGGKGDGKASEEMWRESTYNGWNFDALWSIREGTNNGYPYLFEVLPLFKVVYDGNESISGSVPIDSNKYEPGATVTVLGNTGNLVNPGYTFAGWNTQADGKGTSYTAGAAFPMGVANVTLYAMWAGIPTYTVTYNGNGAASGSAPIDSHAYEQGVTVSVYGNTGNLAKPGHTFAGWNTQSDGKGTSYAAGAAFPMGMANVTLYAIWMSNPALTFTVTYDGNGAVTGNVPIDSNAYEQGVTVSVYGNTGNLLKPGYTFAGWNTRADGKGSSYAAGATFSMGIANVTLYAMWTSNPMLTYTVTYSGNGAASGSVPIDSHVYEQGVTVSVYGNIGNLMNPGYTFAGWNTRVDGKGSSYAAGATFPIGTANVTLYAMWTSNPALTYTVTYNGNDAATGNVPIDSHAYETGTTVTVLDNTGNLAKPGYTFAGWNTQSDGKGISYAAGTAFPMGAANVTLYAKWTSNPPLTYTVMYDGNGAESGSAPIDSHAYETGTTVTVLDNTGNLMKPGYTFAGWNTQSDGNGTSYASGAAFPMGVANVTLYAMWTSNPPLTYTVTYDGNGAESGSVPIDSHAYETGTTVTVLDNTGNLMKPGYTFTGWNTQSDGNGTSYATGAAFPMDAANVTLYAKWTVNNTGGSSRGRSSGGSSSTPSSDTVISTNGSITLPLGKKGELSLGDEVKIVISDDAFDKELQITINRVTDVQNLFTGKDGLASPIFEILKNVPENFSEPITLTFTFNPNSLKDHQKPSVFYYDESKKVWVDIGGEVNGNAITVTVDHFTKFAVFAIGQETDAKQPVNFSDIAGHWAEAIIRQSVGMGFVSGYPDGTFNPDGPITRAEFTVMLTGALKLEGSSEELAFTDNGQIGSWAKQSVARAVWAGIVSGYEDGSFRPTARITRAEMAVMIARALKFSLDENATTSFADDREIPKWAKATVEMIRKQGIVSGRDGNSFVPNDTATRAEAIVMALRMLKVRDTQ
ncbi:InlB B-repeat-containing protein [Paenibacillus piri]|uniref:Uncharacterized protein n=1 Tax=Paenibacillus piri TaxID=2547395 RepID=A0A4V6PIG2_9BACL|nr:InlB B-repeat-containing protein [Paenibacillus piri]TDF95444.1 hypothetical protein E1757_20255 [Paenibacillus piri]